MRFTVSILCHTALRQAKACIASILKSTQPFKLILTANGNPEAAAYFQQLAVEFPNITVVINPNNEGYIAPQTHAFSFCDTEFWLMLNDDTVLPRDWLDKIAAEFDKYPTSALVAPQGGCQSLAPTFHGHKGRNFEYLNGACLACKTSVIRKHGLFDPHLVWAYGDDAELSLRMRELGYTLHYADFFLEHEIGATSRYVKDVRMHQNANHEYLLRRFSHYMRVRTFGYPIVIKRGAAHGDVLLTTPLIRAIHERSPLSPIYVETLVPQIFANHPFVTKAERRAPVLPNAQVIDLNNAYESRPDQHICDAYSKRAEMDGTFHNTEIFLSDYDNERAAKLMPEGTWTAMHTGPSTWKSKEWPHERWVEVIAAYRKAGGKVVLVGTAGPKFDCDLDQRGLASIHESAALIKRAHLFIGLDSLPLHLAEAVGTPTVGLFGITDPKYIITRPEKSFPACATTPSFGLRHRVRNSTSVDDGGEAMRSITVDMVLAKGFDKVFSQCRVIS